MAVFKTPKITTVSRLALTLDASEIVYDLDLQEFFGGDGSTLGGFPIGKGSTGNGGGAYNVQFVTLTPQDIINKYIILETTPTSPEDVLLTPEGGLLQLYGQDYTVSANHLSWDGLGLDGFLEAGEYLIIQIPTGAIYGVETFTLSAQDIINKFVTLSVTPTSPTDVILTPEGGIQQRFGIDFTVNGNIVSWDGYGLDGFLEQNEVITIQY